MSAIRDHAAPDRPMDRAGPMENAQTRFPQVLGRRTERAAHNAPQALFVSPIKSK